MEIKSSQGASASAQANLGAGGQETVLFRNKWVFECYDSEGNLKWVEEAFNTVVNEGLDDILTQYWKGSTYTAAHYVGLTDGTPTPAAGDNLTTHTGWAEVSAYSGNRPALTLGAVSGQSVDNSASKASFSITGTATVGGAFIATVNTGTAGKLIAVVAFDAPGDRTVASGDTLNVTITLTAASA